MEMAAQHAATEADQGSGSPAADGQGTECVQGGEGVTMMESKNWRPSKWTEEAIRRRVNRVYRRAKEDLAMMVGPYLGNLLFAEMVTKMRSEQSAVELHRRGVRLIGDVD